jgi:hypothetical protein
LRKSGRNERENNADEQWKFHGGGIIPREIGPADSWLNWASER